MKRWLASWVVPALLAGGCWSTDYPPEPGVEVVIGVPDEVTGLGFVPLEDGGEVRLETFGQGGTHAALAVRCIGFGSRAFVDVTIENLLSGDMVMTTPAARVPLLLCREENVCDMIPVNVMTGGLADPDDKDGLPIRITAEVHNEAGLMGIGTADGILVEH